MALSRQTGISQQVVQVALLLILSCTYAVYLCYQDVPDLNDVFLIIIGLLILLQQPFALFNYSNRVSQLQSAQLFILAVCVKYPDSVSIGVYDIAVFGDTIIHNALFKYSFRAI